MYHDILIPTDGATGVRRSLDEGVGLAADFGATVHALYVVDVREYGVLSQRGALGLDVERESAGEEAVGEVVARADGEGVDVAAAIERGVPHAEILAYADRNDVDLIVMATHARTGLDRFLLGSVTEKVVRAAGAPVLVVRADVESDAKTADARRTADASSTPDAGGNADAKTADAGDAADANG